jgi:hypothetical protein
VIWFSLILGFSDRFSNLLRFADFFVSGLTSSASALVGLSSGSVLFLWRLIVFISPLPTSLWCLFHCQDLFLPLSGQLFAGWSWFWILMGRALLIRVRELASCSGNILAGLVTALVV